MAISGDEGTQVLRPTGDSLCTRMRRKVREKKQGRNQDETSLPNKVISQSSVIMSDVIISVEKTQEMNERLLQCYAMLSIYIIYIYVFCCTSGSNEHV